ncbi:BTAD domain-containing putative transcriptional regulator [Streptomyces sp. NPDC005423]|uniref:BTAD domain-containing putative transcriptional regulator n=1 Tax=Streptomyces sp. NPDC005423 TaxID=3155343 RepID=UPI0033A77A3C
MYTAGTSRRWRGADRRARVGAARTGGRGPQQRCCARQLPADGPDRRPGRGESAHREVTAVHLAEGNTAEALRHFESYRGRLRNELGRSPSTGYRRMLAPYLGRPLDADAP